MKRAVMKLVEFSVNKPWTVVFLTLLLTALFAAQFPGIKIDTDPENMLRETEPIRTFHQEVKRDFGINELIVLGIVREDGIYRTDSLEKIKRITDEVLKIKGVISDDVISLTVTNNVVAGGGVLYVRPPMLSVPETGVEIKKLKKEVLDNPLFRDRLVSSDGKGAVIYIPIKSKDMAHDIGEEIKTIYQKEHGPEKYYMAGLPIAEDTFGNEMFLQMAVVAPMAGGLVMIVLFVIFRKISLIIPTMIISMLSVIWTMGGEPALAIFRNAVVVGIGFLPLMVSTLTPYITVGLFFKALAFFSGVTTLVFLPALIGSFKRLLLRT